MRMAALSSLVTESLSFPVIVILGSTGVGKTKLGIELARRINGEVISADSMQVYKGLDIITAKVTPDEQRQCKHHMIDVVSPLDKFNVVDFRNMALPIVSDISSRNKVPIIVGGTNYYIESLLWDILVDYDNDNDKEAGIEKKDQHGSFSAEQLPPEAQAGQESNHSFPEKQQDDDDYRRLKLIDPVAASKVHPNDKRKVKRKLQISEMNAHTSTDAYKKQRDKEGSDHLGGPLRFKNTLVFWLCCEEIILKERLSKRVDEMLKNGLVEEISDFYAQYQKDLATRESKSEPYTEGIFQAIGFKEFHNFLTNKSTNDDDASKKMLEEGIEALKRVTVRYSKKQATWVRNRFLKRPEWSSPNVYKLDTSILDQWDEIVMQPALKATEEFLKGDKVSLEPVPKIIKDPNDSPHRQYVCDVCYGRLIVGDSTWNAHCKSRKHKKLSSKKRKLEEIEC